MSENDHVVVVWGHAFVVTISAMGRRSLFAWRSEKCI